MTLLFIPRAGCAAEPAGARRGLLPDGRGVRNNGCGAVSGSAPRARPQPGAPAPSPAAARGGGR